MLNARTLFPPLFRPVDSGGGGGNIREKIAEIDSEITRISDDITQIDSAITRLTNATDYNNKVLQNAHYSIPDVQSVISNNTIIVDANFATTYDSKRIVAVEGYVLTHDNDDLYHLQIPISQATDPTRLNVLAVVNDEGELRLVISSSTGSYIPRSIDIVVYFYEREV